MPAPVLAEYLKALRLVGRQASLARATDVARAELAKSVAASWARPQRDSFIPVFDLARTLGESAAYPREWVDYLLATLHNEDALGMVRLADARFRNDWHAVLDAANDLINRNPTEYDLYWPKAKALAELGKPADAIAPLNVYLKYSRNEAEYPDAVELRKKLLDATPTPGR